MDQRERIRLKTLVALVFATSVAVYGLAYAETASVDEILRLVGELRGNTASVVERLGSAPASAEFQSEAIEYFETHVRPVLAEYCFECHGPETQKSGMRLDSRAGVLTGGERGPAIVPGDVVGSRLVRAIHREGELKMPPENPLPDSAVTALTEWVRMGAPWPEGSGDTGAPPTIEEKIAKARARHWAFQPVRKPAPPALQRSEAARTELDAFVIAKLEPKGLSFSPPADRRTLIRRAYFDLIGLPPTVEQVEAFVNDPSPNAFEKVADVLLASPHYGERWARHWMDLARYSDTKGYVFEEERNFPFSHTYRDYLIRSFNEDLPYDQFLVQQLAADQLDLGDDKRPLAAMGLLTIGRRFIGVLDDQIDDRIDVVTRGMLGLTVSCARCHDHKFDPIPAEDYYSLYGVFRSSHEPGELPLIAQPDPDDPKYKDFLEQVSQKETAMKDFLRQKHVEMLTQARERAGEYLLAAYDTRDITEDDPFRQLAKDRKLYWQIVEKWRTYLKADERTSDPVLGTWKALAALPAETFEAQAPSTIEQTAQSGTVNAILLKSLKEAPPKSMAEVCDRYAALICDADAAWKNLLAAVSVIEAGLPNESRTRPEKLEDADMEGLRLAVYGPASPANLPESAVSEYRDIPTHNRLTQLRTDIERAQANHPGRPDRAMVMVDADTPYQPYVFKRGKEDNKGPEVPRQFLAILSGADRKPFEHGSGRLELARAIASKDNPLTARVFVNRVWMQLFGEPLVATTSDFGLRSDPPTNPELLDYLAATFMESGWSIKQLHRAILLSTTYQQSSADNPAALAVDSQNALLWRQNVRRLDFEAMRDAVLAASGNLDLGIGGESVTVDREPYTPRRSVYARIDRQNLPSMFRTFDLASPDTHAPRRYQTTAPQQALYMLNDPFMAREAQLLAARSAADEPDQHVRNLYREVYQRDAAPEEIANALEFIDRQQEAGGPEPPAPPAWRYGYGAMDESVGNITSFTEMPTYINEQWQGAANLPDAEFGWVSLTNKGGHPGRDSAHASVRRWVAPRDGVFRITGVLKHENENGDGVFGCIVSSREGVLWRGESHNAAPEAVVERAAVQKGDTIDFLVAAGGNDGYDSYSWSPTLRLVEPNDQPGRMEWSARAEFGGPPPPPPVPLAPWEQYAQVLLMTNEFLFVD